MGDSETKQPGTVWSGKWPASARKRDPNLPDPAMVGWDTAQPEQPAQDPQK